VFFLFFIRLQEIFFYGFFKNRYFESPTSQQADFNPRFPPTEALRSLSHAVKSKTKLLKGVALRNSTEVIETTLSSLRLTSCHSPHMPKLRLCSEQWEAKEPDMIRSL